MVLSYIGLIVGLGLLMFLTMRGINIIIAAVISSIIVALTGGLNLIEALTGPYMESFTGFFASWFLVFLLGAIFGKVMEDTRAADSIAEFVKNKFGAQRAVFAVVAACAIMTYGGVSVFIVGFSVYPIAAALFKTANLPHRFIPACLVFGSISFTMTAPGSPEIQNLIPTEHFGTTPTAGGIIGFLAAFAIMVVGGLALGRMVNKAKANGETFALPIAAGAGADEAAGTEETSTQEKELPHAILAILPLVIVVGVLNLLANGFSVPTDDAVLFALFAGIISGWLLMYKFTPHYWKALAQGTDNALVAITNTCGVVGFGGVASNVPSFQSIVDTLTGMPGLEYAGLAVAVTVIAGISGSASGGLGIALPILAPIYQTQGLDPGAMHRISALASGGLDSLPHNGYVVTTVRAISNETHQRAYKPIVVISIIIPTIVLILAVIGYTIFY
ncbi:GntP family permease [Bacillus piscicola]|uniref:GntP family permease n=1 Tax=Bacillus piscicola TaxID=1632684 RepID=UPI001F08CE0A|nr:GntP family permease [Bacillus piscicola]